MSPSTETMRRKLITALWGIHTLSFQHEKEVQEPPHANHRTSMVKPKVHNPELQPSFHPPPPLQPLQSLLIHSTCTHNHRKKKLLTVTPMRLSLSAGAYRSVPAGLVPFSSNWEDSRFSFVSIITTGATASPGICTNQRRPALQSRGEPTQLAWREDNVAYSGI
ncbi:hypothetical protein B9Z19DRAFT_674136 [Tuber borchii]|uniref:Uncharacterized protein n=1 Tax=Tuber borchii TaxID=42251 RepID=A0A2T6ZZT6_TUBBO|nr:hypothetical protein B9Z19DRAFT_674136 [Tuber borchii]